MFCALHAVVAFGALLFVCSLVRVDAVLLRVRFLFLRFFLCLSLSCKLKIRIFRPIFSRSSPAQSPSPVFFSPFSLYRQARNSPPVFPALGNRCCLHVFHVALSVCRACLGEVPAWYSLFFYSAPCSPTLQTKTSESHFPACVPQERVKFSAVHPLSSKIREFGSSLPREISVNSQQ